MANPLWRVIDRWGPGVIAVVTLLGVAAYGWSRDQRVAELEGVVYGLQNQSNQKVASEIELRRRMDAAERWMVAIYERGSANNWNLPQLPDITRKGVKDEPKEEILQPARRENR